MKLPKSLFCIGTFILIFLAHANKVKAEEYWSYNRSLLNKISPTAPEQKEFLAAYDLFCRSDYKGANTLFLNGKNKYPGSAYFNFGLASILFLQENYKEALEYANIAVSKDPKFLDAVKMRGIIYSALNKPELALNDFNFLSISLPNDKDICRLKGMAELECAHFAQARLELSKGLKMAPKDPALLFLRANICYWDGNYKEVINSLNAAKPYADEMPYLLSAKAWTRLNQFDKAQEEIKKAKAFGRYSYKGRSLEIEDYRYDFQNAEKEPARAWALACGAPLATQNGDGLQSLSGVIPNEKNINQEKKLLIEWWGIHNKTELIEMVNSHTAEGHNRKWFDIKAQIESPLSFMATTISPGRAKIVKTYGKQFGSRGIKAWDLSRNIALCRWGYRCGFLTRDEAFEMIMPQARLIQQTYSSWKQFAYEYYVGRYFWDQKIYLEHRNQTELNVHQLLNDPNSPWRRLNWTTALN